MNWVRGQAPLLSSPVEVLEVIRTELELRGDGKTDPLRRVTQYWSREGALLAEVDPVDERT